MSEHRHRSTMLPSRSIDGMAYDTDDLISPQTLDNTPGEYSRNPPLPFLPASIYVASQVSAEKFKQLPPEVITRYLPPLPPCW
jgi:hypothetical protein